MERVKRTGTQKRITKLKVKPRGQGKKKWELSFSWNYGFFWQFYRYTFWELKN